MIQIVRQMIQIVTILALISGEHALAQEIDASAFLLDRSRPYVFLAFDHIGPREPMQEGEGHTGLWIRVVNNCRLPIIFRSRGEQSGENGFYLEDEVVEYKPLMLQIFMTPQQAQEAETKRRLLVRKLKYKPEGYSFEVSGAIRVQAGKQIVFSVPLNHVDEDWYLRVKFALDLDNSSVSVGPFTYLPFYEWDIPKQLRPAKTPDATQEPRNSPTTLLHERGHVE
jgi:hypothetical protein